MLAQSVDRAVGRSSLALMALACGCVPGLPRGCTAALPLPAVEVRVEALAAGWAATEVEHYVTVPLETALTGVPGLRRMRSFSGPGGVEVRLDFDAATQPWVARQNVFERLGAVKLPQEITPTLAPLGRRVIRYSVEGQRQTATELRGLQDWVVRPLALTVPGVTDVSTCGGLEERVEVRLDEARLASSGVRTDELIGALAAASIPAVRSSSGTVLRVSGSGFHSIADLEYVNIGGRRPGTPLLLRDVASISLGPAPPDCLAVRDELDDAVVGQVTIRDDADLALVTAAVHARLAQALLPPGVRVRPFDEAAPRIRIRLTVPTGLRAADAHALVRAIAKAARATPEVRSVLVAHGRRAGLALPPEELEVVVALAPRTTWRAPALLLDDLVAQLTRVVPAVGLLDVAAEGIGRAPELAGWSPIGLRLAGADLGELDRLAEEVRELVRGLPGVRLVVIDGAATVPKIRVDPDRAALARHGISAADFTTELEISVGGREVAALSKDQRRVPVVLCVHCSAASDDPATLAHLTVSGPDGARLPISGLATLKLESERASIRRVAGRRYLLVRLFAPGQDPGQLVTELRGRLSTLALRPGTSVELEPSVDE